MTDKDLTPSSTHPPIPPTPEDEQFARLRLLRSRRVGIATYKRLLTEHGTAQNALAALPEVARAAGEKNYQICPEGVIRAELKAARTFGAQLLVQGEPPYPWLLNEISDAPPFLWCIGDVSLLSRPMIALVGARNASSLGTRTSKALAAELGAEGYVVVSGLARGVDTAAHVASLDTGTIAVQAGGLDIIYPTENTELALNIGKRGLRLSEQPMGTQPAARHFPQRNRIISGMTAATVVIEAATKSGSLITARDALDQGRDVMAVPGHPFDARAWGGNMLIRDGATLVRSAADVIEALSIRPDAESAQNHLSNRVHEAAEVKTPIKGLHQKILSRLGVSPLAEDQLIRDLKAPAAQVTPALVELELEGSVTRQPGGLLTRSI